MSTFVFKKQKSKENRIFSLFFCTKWRKNFLSGKGQILLSQLVSVCLAYMTNLSSYHPSIWSKLHEKPKNSIRFFSTLEYFWKFVNVVRITTKRSLISYITQTSPMLFEVPDFACKKRKKQKNTPEYKVPPHFQCLEQ